MTAPETLDEDVTWGIGRYWRGNRAVSLRVPLARMRQDTEFAVWVLKDLAVVPERPLVIAFSSADGAQLSPFEYAARHLRVPYAAVEPSTYDAGRLVMFCRGLRPSAVVGVREELLSGLAELGTSIAECFANAGTVLAFPSAVPALAEAGVAVRRLLPLGPTVAVECASGGLHVSSAWSLGDGDAADGMEVSSADGAPELARVPTGIAGTAVQVACSCGRGGQRLELERSADVWA